MGILSNISATYYGPVDSVGSDTSWMVGSFGRPTHAGVSVSNESAKRLSAVFACIRVLAEDIGKLPLDLYHQKGTDREKAVDHPLYALLHDEPNPLMTSAVFRETLFNHYSSQGNGYALIVRDKFSGAPIELWPLDSNSVQPRRDLQTGALIYQYSYLGQFGICQPFDIIHIPCMGFDGIRGYSPIQMAREAIGLGLSAEEYGERLFSQGSTSGLILEYPGKLSDEAIKQIKTKWQESNAGLQNSHTPKILKDGMTAKNISINPNDAQFLESRKFQITEIARFFRMQLHKIGEMTAQKYANIEQESINYVVDTLLPPVNKAEQEFNRKLLSTDERKEYYFKFNINSLLRGDMLTRATVEQKALLSGWLTPNEIRELEERNPIAGGDKLFVPSNMIQGANGSAANGTGDTTIV